MIKIGNFLFHYRNGLFPLVYALLFMKSPPLFTDYRMALLSGLLVASAGQALRLMTIGLEYIVRGGRKRRIYAEGLVQGGVFAHCRNPLYVGNMLIVLGIGLAANSVLFLAIGWPLLGFAYTAIILAEEHYLQGRFGDEFTAYCRRVNRFLPDPRGFLKTISGMHFNWRRLISAEYGSAYMWMAGMILLALRDIWKGGPLAGHLTVLWSLWILLGGVTLAYAMARYLKKSGRLSTP